MKRPCILVVDAEFPGSISTRKLVIETAKFNVVTAYSGDEAVDSLERFPKMDAVVLNASDGDVPCGELVGRLKKIAPKIPIVVTSVNGDNCGGADHTVGSYDPASLLERLKALFPQETGEIRRTERTLTAREERM